MRYYQLFPGLFLAICPMLVSSPEGADLSLHFNRSIPQIEFAANDVQEALQESTVNSIEVKDLWVSDLEAATPKRIVIITVADSDFMKAIRSQGIIATPSNPEAFSIRKVSAPTQTTFWVIGSDPAGAMYGALELAEVIRTEGLEAVRDTDQSPYLALRGTKFNCPLDVRTPSYSDVSDHRRLS